MFDNTCQSSKLSAKDQGENVQALRIRLLLAEILIPARIVQNQGNMETKEHDYLPIKLYSQNFTYTPTGFHVQTSDVRC